jgi:undecaprenyl-diphosphatase
MPPRLPLRHALLLGLVQGPTEVLPVSSSAHIALLPRLAGWSDGELDAESRNSLEVALHAGAAAALLAYSWMRAETGMLAGGECPPASAGGECPPASVGGECPPASAGGECPPASVGGECPPASAKRASPGSAVLGGRLARALHELDGRALATAVLALAPPAFVGYRLEQRLERRPAGPGTIAAGLALGGAAMAWADARPMTRGLAACGPRDGLALGLAQALALLPGVSRNGAALTAARARHFAREDAHVLSWRAGLPVLAGAAALKLGRLVRRGAPPDAALTLGVPAATAFLSTLACAPLIGPVARGRPLWPFALYRAGLAWVSVRASARTHTRAALGVLARVGSHPHQSPHHGRDNQHRRPGADR